MPLQNIPQMMELARQGGYAVGYFESWSLDSLQGVLDAAEISRAPMIIGFNGDFLCREGRVAREEVSWYGALGRAAVETARVPCGLIFNECPNDQWVSNAVLAGFNLIMLADPDAPYDEYVRRVKELTRHAHGKGSAVEAEIGILPSGASGSIDGDGELTDPEVAAKFIAATKIDLLGVSVGNVHIKLDGSSKLDLRRLERIREKVELPLVLHGGTGIDRESLSVAIEMGVTKVNYGTYLKQHYLAAIRRALGADIANPHELLGMGGTHDLLVIGRRAVCDAVLERIDALGCCGKA